MPIRYFDGLKLIRRCTKCGCARSGVLRRERAQWVLHSRCGHVKIMGWTKPTEVLKKEGLVSTETPVDPRAASKAAQERWDRDTAQKEVHDFIRHRKTFTRSRYI